jgi:hypothetical protein
VGRILDTLKGIGADERTLVIFRSQDDPRQFGRGEMQSAR